MQHITVSIFGRQYCARVLRVWPFGTYDVELPDGRCFRVTGLR